MSPRTLIALLVLAPFAPANTIYVDARLATGANNGSTWADAYQGATGLQAALAASAGGDQIWVRKGTYKTTATTTRTISFQLENGVEIYGGFDGTEIVLAQRDWATNATVLSGDLLGDDGSGLYGDNSIHVVDSSGTDSTAVLDGFTVIGGNANGSVSVSTDARGGGMLCPFGTSPTVRNCRFVQNRCTSTGGAVHVTSAATFTGCTFENNLATLAGGACFCNGQGFPKWESCVFRGNSAERGGAMEIYSGSMASVTNCVFVDNVATGMQGGGALHVIGFASAIRNCTIVGNSASSAAAGGIYCNSVPSIANCIVWANSGSGGAMGSYNQISFTAVSIVSYSCVMGGYAGTGNIAADPQFTNLTTRDLTLTIASPCVDAGNNASVPAGTTTDLAGNLRFTDEPTVVDTGSGAAPIVDMGAYEFRAPVVTSYCFGDGTGTPCPCGNDALSFSAATGCLNSQGTGGLLASSGSARIGSDTFVLLVSGIMVSAPCLYFQGTTQVNGGLGAAFGDGLRCAGGTIVRLGIKVSSGGASHFPAAGDRPVSAKGGITSAGSLRCYQVWYRDAASFCAVESFNFTNALSVTWAL